MKTKLFALSFIAVSILLCVSCGKKQSNTDISESNKTENTELSETNESEKEESQETATKDDIYDWKRINERIALIIELVNNRDKEGLSRIIRYPLNDGYALGKDCFVPPIRNERDFIERFDEIFDAALIEKISNADPQNILVSWRGVYMMEKLENRNDVFIAFECFYDDYDIKYIECSNKEKLKTGQD